MIVWIITGLTLQWERDSCVAGIMTTTKIRIFHIFCAWAGAGSGNWQRFKITSKCGNNNGSPPRQIMITFIRTMTGTNDSWPGYWDISILTSWHLILFTWLIPSHEYGRNNDQWSGVLLRRLYIIYQSFRWPLHDQWWPVTKIQEKQVAEI